MWVLDIFFNLLKVILKHIWFLYILQVDLYLLFVLITKWSTIFLTHAPCSIINILHFLSYFSFLLVFYFIF